MDRVYKYRSGLNEIFERDVHSLINNELYLSSITELNDVFEAKVCLDENSFYVGRILKYLPWFRYTNSFKDAEEKHLEITKNFIDKKQNWGIYSLSQTYKHKSLWGNYASSYSGFCIEYDLDILLSTLECDTYVIKVIYQNEAPVIDIEDLTDFQKYGKSLYPKIIGTKSKEWEPEQEIRIVSSVQGLVKYSVEAVVGVYLGFKMKKENRDTILQIFSKNDINIFEILPSNNSYDLERRVIQ